VDPLATCQRPPVESFGGNPLPFLLGKQDAHPVLFFLHRFGLAAPSPPIVVGAAMYIAAGLAAGLAALVASRMLDLPPIGALGSIPPSMFALAVEATNSVDTATFPLCLFAPSPGITPAIYFTAVVSNESPVGLSSCPFALDNATQDPFAVLPALNLPHSSTPPPSAGLVFADQAPVGSAGGSPLAT
jgi:hypothetical protein